MPLVCKCIQTILERTRDPKLSKVQKYKLSDDNSKLDAELFILTTHIAGLDLYFLSTKQKN